MTNMIYVIILWTENSVRVADWEEGMTAIVIRQVVRSICIIVHASLVVKLRLIRLIELH